ncbi:hypothetical protein PR048_026829 [Dryococelus australis]|uniref:Uncharacterized protein n=1 Tax=Dryococelus australis TaxID=614101 RepID=A0ABQ9GMD5_9NEOP|nr:hypothetical protein PR048_026829 [Dryococelus australis]
MYPKIGFRGLHATICESDKCHARNVKKQELNVRIFVESLQCTETHYYLGKTLARHYLPGLMSISKLLRMYNAKVTSSSQQVKSTFFRNIVTRE